MQARKLAQVSRSIANSLRRAVYAGNPSQATDIIKRLKDPVLSLAPGSHPTLRFASHALIHALRRDGRIGIAFYQVETYVKYSAMHGMRGIHKKTLYTVYDGLSSLRFQLPHAIILCDSSKVLNLLPQTLGHYGLRKQAKLLLLARNHMVPRTLSMYRRLFEGLMQQGELLAATLVFEMMARDYYLSRTSPALIDATSDPEVCAALQARQSHLALESIYPDRRMFDQLVTEIKTRLLKAHAPFFKPNASPTTKPILPEDATPSQPNTEANQAAYQSLAILGALLDRRQLNFSDLGALLDTFVLCLHPNNRNDPSNLPPNPMVWVDVHPEPVHIHLRPYVWAVMRSLARTLTPHTTTSRSPIVANQDPPDLTFKSIQTNLKSRKPPEKVDLVPWLTVKSHNALLRAMFFFDKNPELSIRVLLSTAQLSKDDQAKLFEFVSVPGQQRSYKTHPDMICPLPPSTLFVLLKSRVLYEMPDRLYTIIRRQAMSLVQDMARANGGSLDAPTKDPEFARHLSAMPMRTRKMVYYWYKKELMNGENILDRGSRSTPPNEDKKNTPEPFNTSEHTAKSSVDNEK